MSINPKQIIENKAKTLTSNLSTAVTDAVANVDLSQSFGDMKNATGKVYDASGAVSVLTDKFSKIDATGLTIRTDASAAGTLCACPFQLLRSAA